MTKGITKNKKTPEVEDYLIPKKSFEIIIKDRIEKKMRSFTVYAKHDTTLEAIFNLVKSKLQPKV